MGLIKDIKKLRFDRQLKESGVLDLIEELKKEIAELKKPYIAPILTKEEEEKIKSDMEQKVTPEEYIKGFTGEEEEFYPNGKPEK